MTGDRKQVTGDRGKLPVTSYQLPVDPLSRGSASPGGASVISTAGRNLPAWKKSSVGIKPTPSAPYGRLIPHCVRDDIRRFGQEITPTEAHLSFRAASLEKIKRGHQAHSSAPYGRLIPHCVRMTSPIRQKQPESAPVISTAGRNLPAWKKSSVGFKPTAPYGRLIPHCVRDDVHRIRVGNHPSLKALLSFRPQGEICQPGKNQAWASSPLLQLLTVG